MAAVGQGPGFGSQATVLGAEVFAKALAGLTPTIQKAVARTGLKDGAAFLAKETAKRIPLGPEKTIITFTKDANGKVIGGKESKAGKKFHLKFNIGTRALKRSRTRIGYRVIVKNPDNFKRMVHSGPNKGKEFFYPTVVEYGSAKRGIPAHPFMRPAFNENVSYLTTLLNHSLRTAILLEADGINHKTKKAR